MNPPKSPRSLYRANVPRAQRKILLLDNLTSGREEVMGDNSPPPGWYADYENPGARRWWDGTRWTAHLRWPEPPPPPIPPPVRAVTPPSPAVPHRAVPTAVFAASDNRYGYAEPADSRPIWKKKRVALPTVAFGLLVLGGVAAISSADPEVEVAAVSPDATGLDEFVGQAESNADDESAGTSSTIGTTSTTASITTTSGLAASSTTVLDDGQGAGSLSGAEPSEAEGQDSGAAAAAPPDTPVPTTAPPATEAPATVPPTTAPAATAAPATEPPTTVPATTAAPVTEPPATPDCHPAYSPCLPNLPGDALNCGDLSSTQKPVTVHNTSYDPYGLDADNDGTGCESG